MKNHLDPASRISFRAVSIGVFSTFAFMLLFMLLIAAFGIWDLRLSELTASGLFFWILASAIWIVSLFLGSFIASTASRAQTISDGTLNAVATWAGSCMFLGFIIEWLAPTILQMLLVDATVQFFLIAFVADIVGLGFGVLGGVMGARFELKQLPVEANEKLTPMEPVHA